MKKRRTSIGPPSCTYALFTCAKHDAARSIPERRTHAVLDRNVSDVVVPYVGRGFHFDEPPSTVPASMQDIDAHQHAAVLASLDLPARQATYRNIGLDCWAGSVHGNHEVQHDLLSSHVISSGGQPIFRVHWAGRATKPMGCEDENLVLPASMPLKEVWEKYRFLDAPRV